MRLRCSTRRKWSLVTPKASLAAPMDLMRLARRGFAWSTEVQGAAFIARFG